MPNYVTIKPKEVEKTWLLVDAKGIALGRLASQVASILQGKNKASYSPQWDLSDHVVIINAGQIMLTGNKANTEIQYRHTGYPGGIKKQTLGEMRERKADEMIRKAIKGMLPRNRLTDDRLNKLHIYVGAEHPHIGQQPTEVAVGK